MHDSNLPWLFFLKNTPTYTGIYKWIVDGWQRRLIFNKLCWTCWTRRLLTSLCFLLKDNTLSEVTNREAFLTSDKERFSHWDKFVNFSLIFPTNCDEETNNVKMMGDISRINRYGTQSHCIDTTNVKKFCYCKKQRWHNIFVSIIDKIIASGWWLATCRWFSLDTPISSTKKRAATI
jgi:hypothetical protein